MLDSCDLTKCCLNFHSFRMDATRALEDELQSLGRSSKASKESCTFHLYLDPLLTDNHSILLNTWMHHDSLQQILPQYPIHTFQPLSTIVANLKTFLGQLKDSRKTETKETGPSCEHHIILLHTSHLSPSIKDATRLIQGLQELEAKKTRRGKRMEIYVYCVPRRETSLASYLQAQGVLTSSVQMRELGMPWLCIDTDRMITMDPTCLYECYLAGQKRSCWKVANGLLNMEKRYGLFGRILFKGQLGQVVWKILCQLKEDRYLDHHPGEERDEKAASEFDTLVILDRKMDLVSALVTPLTYEGLLHEIIGIHHGIIKVKKEWIPSASAMEGTTASEGKAEEEDEDTATYALNANDELYDEIRYMNIEELGFHLQKKANDLSVRHSKIAASNEKTSITELQEFVKKVPELKQQYQALQLHVDLVSKLQETTTSESFRTLWKMERSMMEGMNMYEELKELIYQQEPVEKVLRLLCLQSLTTEAFQEKTYQEIQRLMTHSYGYEILFGLENLLKAGILRCKGQVGLQVDVSFAAVKEPLSLIQEKMNSLHPNNIAYVTSGYAPLSVRLVEEAVYKTTWANIKGIMKKLPGPTAELTQRGGRDEDESEEIKGNEGNKKDNGNKKEKEKVPMNRRPRILVCYVGGVSHTELAALNFVKNRASVDLVVASTSIIGGNDLIRSFLEPMKSRFEP